MAILSKNSFLLLILKKKSPDDLHHLKALSFVGYHFQYALSTYDANIGGRLNICNALKDSSPNTRMRFAATSEFFLQHKETPQI